ncbi:MAG: hypothetical protein OXC95_07230, partial [Dehalococcoidia bacterium]|nr:hypothetical protein [Dehalococcoidia bacterium]
MTKRRAIWGIGALVAVLVVIAAFVLIRRDTTDDAVSFYDIPRPAPRIGPCPIAGDPVSIEEARRRTPYTIPVPPLEVVGAGLILV